MKLLSRASKYLQEENEKFDSRVENVGVSTAEYADEEYEIKGYFPEEEEEDRVKPPQEFVYVEESSEMGQIISDVFEEIRSNVSVTEAEISSIHISSTIDEEDKGEWFGSGYTSKEADARVFIRVTKDHVPVIIQNKLSDVIVSKMRVLDTEFMASNIKNAKLWFSDSNVNLLNLVRGDVLTSRPHNHVTVDSLEEYVDVVADEGEYEELYEQSEYEVFYLLDKSSQEFEDIQTVGEEVMQEFMNNSLDTDWETIFEAEIISFGDFDPDDIESEKMAYYVNIPIVGDTIGVTR